MSTLPSFWPSIKNGTWHLRLLRNGERWLTLLQHTLPTEKPDPTIEASVLGLGFQKGTSGRYFYPDLLNDKQAQVLCRLFGADQDILDPSDIFYLEGADKVESNLPAELRDGIAWWWANSPKALVNEIRMTLASKNTDEYADWRERFTEDQWRNPDRLKDWVTQALEGEVSPVTEPIIGLGLARASKNYPDELPSDLQQWADRLTEFRGDPITREKVVDTKTLLDDTGPDQRPPAGETVRWHDSNHALQSGRVTHLSDEDKLAFWVMPDHPSYIEGILMPRRERIRVDQLDTYKPVVHAETETGPFSAPSSQAQWTRREVTRDDIPSETIRAFAPTGSLSDDAKLLIRGLYKTGKLNGIHPLTIASEFIYAEQFVPHWPFVQSAMDIDMMGDTPYVADARAYTRDMLIAEFNEQQPEWPEGREPLLAVVSTGTQDAMASMQMATQEGQDALDDKTVYGIGLHPLYVCKLRDQIEDWSDNEPEHHKHAYREGVRQFLMPLLKGSLSLRHLIPGVASVNMRRLAFNLDGKTPEEKAERVENISGGLLFPTLADAQKALTERFILGEAVPENTARANQEMLDSLAMLSGQSRQYIERLSHPLFQLTDELIKAGGIPSRSRSETLAAMGINLKEHPSLMGQIGTMAGIEIPLLHSTAFSTASSDDQKLVGEASTGILKNLDGEKAFTFGTILQNQERGLDLENADVNVYYLRDRIVTHDPKSRMYYSGLGYLVELNSMSPLKLSSEVSNTVIKQEHLTDMEPTWYCSDSHANKIRLSFDTGGSLNASGFRGIESMGTAVTDSDAAKAITDAVSSSQKGIMNRSDQNWRTSQSATEQLQAAIKMFVTGNKILSTLKSTERAEDLLFNMAREQPCEMLGILVKKNKYSIRYAGIRVSIEDLEKFNFDRTAAAEMAMYKAKERYGRGWQGGILDLLSVTRPEVMTYLNEMKDEAEKAAKSSNKETVKRGARQSKGVVAGLSIKDLRGKASEVIQNLMGSNLDDQGRVVTKTKLWEAPDWAQLRSPEDGSTAMEPQVAAWFSQVRKILPGKPPANVEGLNLLFAQLMLTMRDGMESVRTLEELTTFIQSEFIPTLNDIDQKRREFSISSKALIGPFSWGADYESENCMRKARQLSGANTTWPTSLGVSRIAAKRQIKDDTGAMPMLKRLERMGGEDYRKGLDTDEENLIKTFGFSGVEYGESMTQKERTEYLNYAFDGFMDLARALGVSPQSLSLGGTLGLAFGSRGRGGRNAALAHFEPSNNAINLTRLKGAGSMAHEFGHALANHFARQITGSTRGPGDLSETVNAGGQFQPLQADKLGGLRKEIYDSFALIMATLKLEPKPDSVATELPSLDYFAKAYEFRSTSFVEGARLADANKKEPYWGTAAELFARSFETWVNQALKDKDPTYQNDFLVRPDKLKYWGKSREEQAKANKDNGDAARSIKPQLYPSGNHLHRVGKAFRNLFDVALEGTKTVRHEHLGDVEMPYLYSHDFGVQRLAERDMRPLAQCVLSEITRMCGDNVETRWLEEIRDDQGRHAAARFSVIEGDPESPGKSVRGLVEISYNANLIAVYHEAFHYAQELLFTDAERSRLDHDFQQGSELHQRLVRTLVEQGKGNLIEHCRNPRETQAYAYQEWVKGNLDLKVEEEPRSLFGQMKEFFGRVFGVSRQTGFTSAESLFQAFYDGRLAARADLFEAQTASDKAKEEQERVEVESLEAPAHEAANPEEDEVPELETAELEIKPG